jgi:hypothetical protein
MSWVQLNGETWRATQDVAEVKLQLWRPDAMCGRQEWSFELSHLVRRAPQVPGLSASERALTLRLETLGLELRDWRSVAGKEIRADAGWHEKHGRCHEYGRLRESSLWVSGLFFPEGIEASGNAVEERDWRAVDFVMRFGKREGMSFPMELDAWVMPEAEFWRKEPESEEELRRFGEGPPNLRVMATAVFTRGWVMLPHCEEPVALARRFLREEVGFDVMHEPQIQFPSRQDSKVTEFTEVPEWPATVYFRTEEDLPTRRRRRKP